MEVGPGITEGNYYLIICKANDKALKIAAHNSDDYEGSRLDCDEPNENDLRQIFLLDNVNKKEDGWEIVNCLSSLVLDENKEEINLCRGKQKKDQLFAITPAANEFHQYYYIHTDTKSKKSLEFEGVLRDKGSEEGRASQMFRFQPVNFYGNPKLATTALLINKQSGKAIDVPGATTKKGTDIVQWEKNNRFNQRWCFVQHGKGYIIQSLFNGLVLDIEGGKKKKGVPIIQWDKSGDSNQVWIPEQCGERTYRFRSAHDGSLYLGVDKESLKDGARLETFEGGDSTCCQWECVGHQPNAH